MANGKKTKSGWTVTAPMAACAIGFLAFVFVPGVKQYREKCTELDTKRAYIVQAGAELVYLQQAEQELASTLAYNMTWQSRVPDEPQMATLYGDFNTRCQAAGAGILRFEPKESVAYGQISHVPLVLETQGSYPQIVQMLAGLESTSAPVWFEGLQIEFVGKSGQDANCKTTLAVFADNVDNSN